MDFANIIREEAVLFLLDLPRGEEVIILAQKKKDGQWCRCNVLYKHIRHRNEHIKMLLLISALLQCIGG